jgi:hypothetical protein
MTFSKLKVGDEFQIQNRIRPVVTFPIVYRKTSAFGYIRIGASKEELALADHAVVKVERASPLSP